MELDILHLLDSYKVTLKDGKLYDSVDGDETSVMLPIYKWPRIVRLVEEHGKMKKALEYYANSDPGETWGNLDEQYDIIHPNDVEEVGGEMVGGMLARETLKEIT